ncbi:MAG: prolipoprotein diacylglyceryl transferase, partial [Ruminococcus sp.]|nr:prolipoprotein diacylglyceryl transferase [Ruminococcus sp.]
SVHSHRFGIDPDKGIDAIIGGVIGGLIGARVYYVALRWDEYKGNIKEILNTRNGGLAIYGGIIGALTVGLIICKIKKIKMLPMLDITVIGLLIGQGIGRWGNFVNQEAFGTNTDSIFGMTGGRIQATILRQSAYMDGTMQGVSEQYAVHPCFLYESFWCLLGFVVLALWSRRRKYDGQLLLMYMAWYGGERFIVEGLRTDSLTIGNIRVSQALSAIIFVTSVILQIIMASKVRRDPESYVLYASTEESLKMIEEARRKRMGLATKEEIAMGTDDDDDIGILPDEDDEDDDTSTLPDENDNAEDAAEEVQETAADAAEKVQDTAAEEVHDTITDTAEESADTVTDTAENAEDKYEVLAEQVDERLTGGSRNNHSKKKKHK